MEKKTETYQVAVIGGGLAGLCAAIASARNGAKTCLIHNRPVLGGNSSSEVRVTPHGAAAFHAYARETGIISELLIQERAVNHEEIFENGWTNSVWDMVQYDMACTTEGLTLYLNTDCREVIMDSERKIKAVRAYVLNAETELTVNADIFIDCTGDGTVAFQAGCQWRMGSEGRDEFGEPHAPIHASNDIMGSSIHFKTKRMDHPVPFEAPGWAMKYDDASFFYQNGRPPKDERGGYWWIEIGVPFDTIHQNEDIRHELTRHALGVWDWMKNRDPKMKDVTKNYVLDWIGQVVGKRESRRIMGRYFMTEHDPQNRTVFDDEIAFGGWFIDIHTPGGLLAEHSEPASGENYDTFTDYAVQSYAGPYGIPLRCLIARDVDNLMMAGRNVSVSHAAFGSVRVMATGALMGQAAGTAAAMSVQDGTPPGEFSRQQVSDIQQRLLRSGCFLPNYRNTDPLDLARKARLSASSSAAEYGAGPDSIGYHRGLSIWTDQPQYTETVLHNRRGQFIAVGPADTCHENTGKVGKTAGRIDSISICVSNDSGTPQRLEAKVLETDGIFDYRIEGLRELFSGSAEVPPGKRQWIDFDVKLDSLAPGRFIRLDIMPNENIEWHMAGRIVTGHIATYQIAPDKMRRFGSGHTLSFRTTPAQRCYEPGNITSGVTRPAVYTNLWKSDPAQPLPQYVTLEWDTPQRIGCIELTFPGHLLRELHAYRPEYRDPQCPKDYTVEALVGDRWVTLETIEGNYQRRNCLRLDTKVETTQLKVTVMATNGDPSAQIYEIRCYE